MVNLHPAVILDNVARTTPAPRFPFGLEVRPPSILDSVQRAPRPHQRIRPSCFWTGFILGVAACAVLAVVIPH